MGRGGRARSWRLGGAVLSLVLVANLPIVQGIRAASAQGPPGPEEILEERTATSRTFRDPDGSLRTELFSTPIHYQQGDEWLPISSTLVPSTVPGYGWQNEANSFRVLFKELLETNFLRFSAGGSEFGFTLGPPVPDHEKLPEVEPKTDGGGGNQIRYPEPYPGVTLEYEVLADGIKETLVLANANTPPHYVFTLQSLTEQPVEAQEQPDGSWAFYVQPNAGPVFTIDAPFAVDASPEGTEAPVVRRNASIRIAPFEQIDPGPLPLPDPPPNVVVPVPLPPNPDTTVVSAGGAFLIDLAIDPVWLQDPARVFPVRVDPTVTLQPSQEDASFAATCPDCLPSVKDRLFIGSNSTNAWRGALKFNLAGTPAIATITSAKLKLLYDRRCIDDATMCSGVTQQINAHRMTASWTTSTKTSGLQFDPTPLSSYTLAAPGNNEQWMSWDITTTLKNWRRKAGEDPAHQPNHGILLKRSTEPLGAGGPAPPGRRFSEVAVTPKIEIISSGDGVDLFYPDTLHANGADLDWSRYTGPSGAPFSKYEVHRAPGTDINFAHSSSTLLATIKDINTTSFRDTTAAPNKPFSYKVVANTSATPGQTVTLPADGQARKVLQPGPAEGSATTYAFSRTGTVCSNYGALDNLTVGTYVDITWRSALAFNLGDIPTGATVSSATLSLWEHTPADAPMTVKVHPVTRAWKEGTGTSNCSNDGLTWYQSDNAVNWTTQGGDFDPTSAAQVSLNGNEAAHWDNFTMTSLVQKWVSGQIPNFGVILKAETEAMNVRNDLTYHPDDHGATPGLRPKLTITYADGVSAIKPTVATVSPQGENVAGAVQVLAPAGDDRRVDKVEFLKDGGVIATDTSAPFQATWNTTSADNGAHTLTTKATDDAGNVTTSSGTSVTVQNSNPPTTSVTSPAGGSTVSGTATVTANAGDDLGVDRVEFYFDGTRIEQPVTAAPYSVQWNTLALAQPAFDGTHQLTTRAYDRHGQMTTSAITTVTVANTAGTKYRAGITASTPVPQAITYDPQDPSPDLHGVTVNVTNSSNVTFTTSDVVLRYRWFNPDGTPATDSTPIPLPSNLAPGSSAALNASVAPPVLPDGVLKAEYKLRFDLYDNPTATFFGAKGNPPLDNPIIVNKAISEAALGLERYYHYEGEPVGAGMEHLTNVASGNSLLTWTPFSSPGRGLSTVVGLTYNSLEDHSESPVGSNFSLSVSSLTRFGIPLDVHPNNADQLAGRSDPYIEFTDGDGTTHRFNRNTGGGWDEPAGVHLYLREYPGGDPARKWALTRPDRVTFFYDDEGFPTFVRDKNGNELKFTLETTPPGEDPGGPKKRITRITDAAGLGGTPAPNRFFTIDYYSKAEAKKPQVRGNIEKIIDHNGSILLFEYYEDGNLLRITQKGGTNADGTALSDRSFVFTYTTSSGAGPAIADPANRVNPDPKTSNQSTRLYSVRDPRGTETRFAYFTSGATKWKLQSRTNRTGAATTFAYDITGRLTTVTAPLSRITKYAYDTEGKVTGITNPKNETTTLQWSADRHVTKVTEPTGAFTEFAYNNNGYLTDIWDQLRNRTTLEYENVLVDGNDISSRWKAGRSIAHISQLVKKTNPRGTATATPTNDYQWAFGYDANGNLTSVTEPGQFTTLYGYNANGTLASIRDAENNPPTTFDAYDANGLVTRVTDGIGRVTQFGYDDDGLLRFVQDPLHASYSGGDPRTYRTYFDYDSFHRLGRDSTPKLSSVAPVELIWTAVAYDPNDNVLSEFAAEKGTDFLRGPESKLTHDTMDRVLSSTNPDAEKTAYVYDAAGRLISLTTPKGTATASPVEDFAEFYEYDPLDRVIRETRWGTGGAFTSFITHYCYDLAGDLVSVTPPRATLGSVNCSTANSFMTKYTYDAAHRLRTERDPLGRGPTYGYDADGNLTSITNAINDTTTREFDQRGLLSKVVEPFTATRNLTTMYRYDGVGNLTQLISPRAYDASADKVNFTEYVTTYSYDDMNQLTKVELPSKAGEQKTFLYRSYDANGNMLTTTLPDPAQSLDGVPSSSKVAMSYFDTGWVKTTKDPATPMVTYDYNARGQQEVRQLGRFRPETWRHAPDGMLIEFKDRGPGDNGQQSITYDYDDNNNISKVTDQNGANTPGVKPIEVLVSYDTLDRMTKVRNRNLGDTDTNYRFTKFSYDRNDNVDERADNGVETAAGTQITAPKRHTFTYDAADWLTSQLDYLPSGCQKVDNTFLATGWEETRRIWKADQTCDASPAFGSAPKQSTRWTYFKNGKLNNLTTWAGQVNTGTLLEDHIVDYFHGGIYVNGHRTTDRFKKSSPNPTAPCKDAYCTTTYTYDGRERATREARTSGPTIDYELDPASNLRKKTVTPAGGGAATTTFFTYQNQRLDKVALGTALNFVQRYVYDPADEGNVDCVVVADYTGKCEGATSSQKFKDYHYDHLNRMDGYVSYLNGAEQDKASYVYDPLDRLLQETEKHGSSPTRTTDFAYLGLTNLVTQETQTGDPTKDATKSYAYDAYGLRISLRNVPVAGTTKNYTYAYDVHGSVSLLNEVGTGTAEASYGYDIYGEKDSALSAGDPEDNNPLNPYRYSGKRFDSGSKTLDMGVRRFDSSITRFLTPDLFLGALDNLSLSTDPLTGNRYALAGGNPVTFEEWDGHVPFAEGGGTGRGSPKPGGAAVDRERPDALIPYSAYASTKEQTLQPGERISSETETQYWGRLRSYSGYGPEEPPTWGETARFAFELGSFFVPVAKLAKPVMWLGRITGANRLLSRLGNLAKGAPLARELVRRLPGKPTSRFVVNRAGDVLDISRVTIPKGKYDWLLRRGSKEGVFRKTLGFTDETLGPALERHLIRNFESATAPTAMFGGGWKFNVRGPLTGPSGRTWDSITSVWGVEPSGLIRLITASP
jgi:RHS repeat-associated protein